MKKILVIDDDRDIVDVVKLILTMHGFDVQTHSTGYNVPEIVKEYNPDLVLLDINLPGRQGTDICNDLKQIGEQPPVLLFSAHANEQDAQKACKADGFVHKPFDVKKLVDTINSHAN